MTITRHVLIAIWAFFLAETIYNDRPWKPLWLAVEAVMLVASIAYAIRQHGRDMSKAKAQILREIADDFSQVDDSYLIERAVMIEGKW